MKKVLIAFLLISAMQHLAAEPQLPLGEFSRNRLDGWEHKRFKGETRYQLQTLDGVVALKADSQASASGLFKEQRIDLEQTPILNWSWRIAGRLIGLNEQSKAGDDYAARVYVVVKGGLAFWQTRAISYVWAGNTAKGSVWPNAFTGNHAMMMALRGPEASTNIWYSEKRNVRTDLQKLFGEDLHFIDAVALMTDTDNGGGQVSAFYGDIWFSRD
jgi:hypothetical protein